MFVFFLQGNFKNYVYFNIIFVINCSSYFHDLKSHPADCQAPPVEEHPYKLPIKQVQCSQ